MSNAQSSAVSGTLHAPAGRSRTANSTWRTAAKVSSSATVFRDALVQIARGCRPRRFRGTTFNAGQGEHLGNQFFKASGVGETRSRPA